MTMRTSEEVFEEAQKLRSAEEKLAKQNKGLNLVNGSIVNKPKIFYIKIRKKVECTLTNRTEMLTVDSNFPFTDWEYYSGTKSSADFLEDLEKWVKIPKYKFFVKLNRKQDNIPSSWSITDFREIDVNLVSVVFDIGNEALDSIGDFTNKVYHLLSLQKNATPQEIKDFERYWVLFQSVNDLSRQLNKGTGYCYGIEDITLKLTIGKRDYNRKLRETEKEIALLCRKYPFLKEPRYSYEEIIKKPTPMQFIQETMEELKEVWESFDNTDKAEFSGKFENFCMKKFNEYLQSEDFDE